MADLTATTIERETLGHEASSSADRRTILRLADDVMPRLIERLTASELGELEVREDGWRVRLRRPIETADASGTPQTAPVRPRQRADAAMAADRQARPAPRAQPQKGPVDRGLVTSPGVGYFVTRDNVAVGSPVREGDVLGHVDVLGVRHDVVTPIDGAVRAFEVETGQAVEYGELIARVESRSEAHVQ